MDMLKNRKNISVCVRIRPLIEQELRGLEAGVRDTEKLHRWSAQRGFLRFVRQIRAICALRIHSRTRAYTHAHALARTHAHTRAHTHTYTHAHTRAHTRAHAYMHTRARTHTNPHAHTVSASSYSPPSGSTSEKAIVESMREVRRQPSAHAMMLSPKRSVQFDSARIEQHQLYPFDDVFGAQTSTSELYAGATLSSWLPASCLLNRRRPRLQVHQGVSRLSESCGRWLQLGDMRVRPDVERQDFHHTGRRRQPQVTRPFHSIVVEPTKAPILVISSLYQSARSV